MDLIPNLVLIAIALLPLLITFTIIFLLLHYGFVRRRYYNIPPEVSRSLKSAREEYLKDHVPSDKRSGKRIYPNKGFFNVSFSIYSDGIYGQFCLGEYGRLRFRKWDELTAIYPVHVIKKPNPPDTKAGGLGCSGKSHSIKKLQFETKDYLVATADSRIHDLEKVLSLVQESAGPYWKNLYKEKDLIEDDLFGNRSIGWHSYVRKRD